MATEPTESTDPLTNFFWLLPPPQRRLIDAGLLRMNTGKRSGGKGTTRVGAVGRVFRGFCGFRSARLSLADLMTCEVVILVIARSPGSNTGGDPE